MSEHIKLSIQPSYMYLEHEQIETLYIHLEYEHTDILYNLPN